MRQGKHSSDVWLPPAAQRPAISGQQFTVRVHFSHRPMNIFIHHEW